uniref:Uncharacterized protein n=1 Tax=Rhizoctonia cerealis phyllomonavirus TaxID=3068671 RepID=A0AA51BSG2_9MONO|nr:MAG: hypothetical protein [Rhizoctonia cerealis phyllomonavirus]WMI40131.1 MAG: hypothetical protein [Rhizoctonia cerealis phyllomonavirus]
MKKLTQNHIMQGQENANGFYLPRLNYAAAEVRPLRINPEFRPPGSELPVVHLPRVPQDLPLGAARRLGLNFMLGAILSSASSAQRESWVLAPLEFMESGFVSRRMSGWVTPVYHDLTEEQWRYWGTGELAGPGGTWIPAQQTGFQGLVAVQRQFHLPFMPTTNRVDTGTGIDLQLPAVYGMLLYAVVKTPDGVNDVGFTERRPAAAAASIGESHFPPNLVPSLRLFTYFSSTLVAAPAIRIPLCTIIIEWITSNSVSGIKGALIAQARLWRDHQFGSFHMVRDLVVMYGPVLREVRALAPDLLNFDLHLQRYQTVALTDAHVDYRNARFGNLSDMKALGNYPMLGMLARDYKRLGASSPAELRQWNNFARNTPADLSYEQELRDAADRLGVTIPHRSTVHAATAGAIV